MANRKRAAKLIQKVEQAKKLHFLQPLDDPLEWIKGDVPCPWTSAQMKDYQKRLDSAFGAENAIILAWSYDRRYWDEFYEDWYATGLPKGALAKKPILLFKQVPVSEKDWIYISTPRFLLLERLHGSELEESWEDSSWVQNGETIGGARRIRPEKPPKDFYQVLRTIAQHEQTVIIGEEPPCCRRMWHADKSICYGKYRPPSDADIAFVRRIRTRMDRDGVSQRNDAPRLKKVIENASSATKHFMRQAEMRRATAVKEMILGDPMGYMGSILKKYKLDDCTPREIDTTVREALEIAEEKRFETEKIC